MDPREFEKKTQDELDDILNRCVVGMHARIHSISDHPVIKGMSPLFFIIFGERGARFVQSRH